MTEEITGRIEQLEQSMETVCRPLADLRVADRLIATERALYDSKLRISALESRITELERRINDVKTEAANAVTIAQSLVESRIWQTLVRASSFLARGR